MSLPLATLLGVALTMLTQTQAIGIQPESDAKESAVPSAQRRKKGTENVPEKVRPIELNLVPGADVRQAFGRISSPSTNRNRRKGKPPRFSTPQVWSSSSNPFWKQFKG